MIRGQSALAPSLPQGLRELRAFFGGLVVVLFLKTPLVDTRSRGASTLQ